MNNTEWKTYIVDILKSAPYLALATYAQEVWNNTVYYTYTKTFNFYFISLPTSKHMLNITDNPNVALAIYDTAQPTKGEKRGLQIKGIAKILTDRKSEDYKQACACYYKLKDDEINNFIEEKENMIWQIVKITAEEIWAFDTELFQESRVLIPKDIYNLY